MAPFSYDLSSNKMLSDYVNDYQTPATPQGSTGWQNWDTPAKPTVMPGGSSQFMGFGGPITDPNNMTAWQQFAGGQGVNGTQYGGWGMPAVSAASSLIGGYNSFQNMKNAKDALNFQKDAFSKQFENQRTLVNNELRDRDATRLRRDPGYQSTTQFA